LVIVLRSGAPVALGALRGGGGAVIVVVVVVVVGMPQL